MASLLKGYIDKLPGNIGGAVAISALAEYTSAYFFRGLLHTTSLRQSAITGVTTLFDAAITPLIHSKDNRNITAILRKVITLSALYSCGTPILLINTVVANILPIFEANNPTINQFLFLVRGSFAWTSSPQGAVISVATAAVALIASRILRYVSEKILNESNDRAHALLTSACCFATAFFLKDPGIDGLLMTEEQLWIIKITFYAITATSAYAALFKPINVDNSIQAATPWGICHKSG